MSIRLTGEQAKAAAYGEGSRAIVATAGSGKTTTLSFRIKNLLDRPEVRDSHILATTFTNAGARDFKGRIDAICNRRTRIQSGTIHSFCVQIVMRFYTNIGFASTPTLLSTAQRTTLLSQITDEVVKPTASTTPSRELVDAWFNEQEVRRFSDELRDRNAILRNEEVPRNIKSIYEIYSRRSKEYGYLDFDTLLTHALDLLKWANENPDAAINKYLPRYVFVDEAQDLSGIQWFIVHELAKSAVSVDVIGDDDQSIYGWRAALSWRFRDFANVQADEKFVLSANRRCAKNIVSLARDLIEKIPDDRRVQKDLSSVREDDVGNIRFSVIKGFASYPLLVRKIIRQVEAGEKDYRDFAFIARNSTRIFESLERFLKAKGIPYKILGGQSSFDRIESQLFRAVGNLVIAGNGASEPMAHWNDLFANIGVSASACNNLIQKALGMDGSGSFKCIEWSVREARLRPATKQSLTDVMREIQSLREHRRVTLAQLRRNSVVSELINQQVKSSSMQEARKQCEIMRLPPAHVSKVAEEIFSSRLGIFEKNCDVFSEMPIANALAQMGMTSDVTDDDNFVTITTAHSSKGLEWDSVFVMEANMGCWPSASVVSRLSDKPEEYKTEVLDEERRLLYVAVTRAKNNLFLTSTVHHHVTKEVMTPSEYFPSALYEQANEVFEQVDNMNASYERVMFFDHSKG